MILSLVSSTIRNPDTVGLIRRNLRRLIGESDPDGAALSGRDSAAEPTIDDVDIGLVEEAKAGDLGAFRELVQKYQQRALNVAYGLTRSRDDSEDLVQEAFLKAFKSIHSFKSQSSFYTWFYRILVNLAVDRTRKKSNRYEFAEGDQAALDASAQKQSGGAGIEGLSGAVYDPARAFEISEIRTRIFKAFDSLTEGHRSIILLREIDGLSYEEISEVLNCSKGTVMSRLHYARKKLQEALAELAPDGAETSEEMQSKILQRKIKNY